MTDNTPYADWLKEHPIVLPPPPTEPQERRFGPCAKCGGLEIHVAYHNGEAERGAWSVESCAYSKPCGDRGRRGEHLAVVCRRCQWGWVEEVGSSPERSSPGVTERTIAIVKAASLTSDAIVDAVRDAVVETMERNCIPKVVAMSQETLDTLVGEHVDPEVRATQVNTPYGLLPVRLNPHAPRGSVDVIA